MVKPKKSSVGLEPLDGLANLGLEMQLISGSAGFCVSDCSGNPPDEKSGHIPIFHLENCSGKRDPTGLNCNCCVRKEWKGNAQIAKFQCFGLNQF